MVKDNKTLLLKNGHIKKAIYTEQVLDHYKGNPLIEALPPIFSEEQVTDNLTRLPLYNPREKELNAEVRCHCVNRLFGYFEPLGRHIDLEQRFSRLIRQGYLARNPLDPTFASRLQQGYRIIKSGAYELWDDMNLGTTSSGFTIIGISGIGKTSAVNRILSLYPRVIVHSKFKGINLSLYQITWLKLDCPSNGSLKSLCTNFFSKVDKLIGTNYYRKFGSQRNSVEYMLSGMVQVASSHCLGVLIIDEIQHLSLAKSGGAANVLNFFVTLVNTIGLPVVLIGTPKALSVIRGEFRQARRGSGQGDVEWDRMEKDGYWNLIIEGMWKYQWTKNETPLTDDIKNVIYHESQGIIDIAIKLFVLSQWSAIATGEEVITSETIRTVVRENLKLVKPMLDALKTGDPKEIACYEDIRPIDMENLYNEYLDKLEKGRKTVNTKRAQKTESVFIKEVALRLLDVGIKPKLAAKAAREAVKQDNGQGDIKSVANKALVLALQMEQLISKNSKKKGEPEEPEDLRVIVSNGKKQNKPAYESLQEKEYIKSADEFLLAI